ncbi:MAG: M20/M25/M40 family metallo-hydrolase, partial [Oscillospiraceae bacterium]
MTNKTELMNTLLEYIKIDSETGNEEKICAKVKADLEALGLSVRELGDAQSLGTLSAVLRGDEAKPPIILCAHLDTVIPGVGIKALLCEDGYLRSEGHTILGGDDKSGVAAIMEALRTVIKEKLPHRTLQILFTVREEAGLFGSRVVTPEDLIAKNAVVFDSSGDVGKIITSAPGQMKLTATITGLSAHAGNAPEKGISAILVGASALESMKLLRIDEETTANIGSFVATGPTNIISEKAELVFEIRSRSTEKLQHQADHMIEKLESACAKAGARLDYKLDVSHLGYALNPQAPLIKELFAACEKIGVKPYTFASGGGSDANNFNQMGITAVNVATGMEQVHSTQEQL